MIASRSSTETAPRPRKKWLTRQYVLAWVLVAATLAAFVLCFVIIVPFLTPLAWAVALAVVVHPVHRWLQARVKSATLAAFLTVALVVIVLLAPAALVTRQLVDEAVARIDFTPGPDGRAAWREKLEQTFHGSALLWLDERIDLAHQLDLFMEGLAGRAAGILRESVWTAVNVLIMIFALFFLLRDCREMLQSVRSFMPLSHSETDDFFLRISNTIHGTIRGSLVVCMMQGLLGALIFWLLGLPAPILWGLVLAVLATIPGVGTVIVWGPTAIALALQDEWGKALVLVAWELLAVGLIDNLLYPMVVGTHVRMHTLAIFFAIVGGLLAFGPAGIILGPLVFAVTQALVATWRRRTAGGRAAETALERANGEAVSPNAPPEQSTGWGAVVARPSAEGSQSLHRAGQALAK